jgi:transposase, IS6 family
MPHIRISAQYAISFAHMAEMAAERGLAATASCIWRWVQVYGPEIDKRCRPCLKRTNRSWRVDETYIKIKGRDRFLYRAVDSTGQTVDLLLTDRRNAAAAKRFFRRALRNENAMPRVINADKNPAYPLAVSELKADGVLNRRCRLR